MWSGRACVLVAMTVMTALASGGVASAGPEQSRSLVPTAAAPVVRTQSAAVAYANEHPDAAPPRSNDFRCRPNAAHPRPILLLHGTDSSAYSDFGEIAPMLARRGFCVFAINYGGRPSTTSFGTEDVHRSGRQVAAFIPRVLAATGASALDIIGYSQGATIGRYVIAELGAARQVRRWIGLASPTYGSIFYGLAPLARVPGLVAAVGSDTVSPALVQQIAGSDFLRRLNRGGDTVAGVDYTTIGSRYDEVIQPYTNIALRSRGARNILISDRCAADMVGHFGMPYDRYAQQLLINVADPDHPVRPQCRSVPLGSGIAEVVIGAHS
ncbi:alpha/beta fold hydrolase [Williamsia sp.]|uniref:esterase/lipase family protein n=1 Tax=Williamsia sp. TaxID=1872085 RepID=UPI001A2D4A7B|nr:alpha/beta fold hydrolase [Williamsia sp.]MBJ7290431.1 alpha/beta fold hydrolase [Williamsia sp.]